MTSEVLEDILRSGTISFLMRKHINDCVDCQFIVLNYSESYYISDSVFKRSIEKQKLLWVGAEIVNTEVPKIQGKGFKNNKKNIAREMPTQDTPAFPDKFSKFLAFCFYYKKWILGVGYLALLFPVIRLILALL